VKGDRILVRTLRGEGKGFHSVGKGKRVEKKSQALCRRGIIFGHVQKDERRLNVQRGELKRRKFTAAHRNLRDCLGEKGKTGGERPLRLLCEKGRGGGS